MSIGVLVMAYGTPTSQGDIERFYTDIRRGHRPSEAQLAELTARYEAIGGLSPLVAHSLGQVDALQHGLDVLRPGGFIAVFGTKHSNPSIEDALVQLHGLGVTKTIGIVLAPHYSILSVGEYLERARRHAEPLGIELSFVTSWYDDPVLVELLAERVRAGIEELNVDQSLVEVVFTAHSLPTRIIAMNDPYPDQLRTTADLVAARAEISRYRTAWQSAGRTKDTWLSPSILEVLDEFAIGPVRSVLVCPAGFVADHLEVLYDLDIEAKARASSLGINFARTASLNAEPRLFASLANTIERLGASTWPIDR